MNESDEAFFKFKAGFVLKPNRYLSERYAIIIKPFIDEWDVRKYYVQLILRDSSLTASIGATYMHHNYYIFKN